MNNLMLSSILSLSGVGVLAASILYIASKKFHVEEDPRIDQVEGVLPMANCGGCGFAGCRNFAEAVVKAGKLDGLNCPVGGAECMAQVAHIMGVDVQETEPMVAVLRCNGSRKNAPQKTHYDGALNCFAAHALFAGESGCPNGCLGLGDCAVACSFDAITVNPETGLPEVDDDKCVACGACVTACPRDIYELRPKGINSKRVYVACMNTQKGAPAKKNCSVACIGCMKCVKATESKSVSVKNFLSYIGTDVDTESHGPQLIDCCPTSAILGVNIEGSKNA
ncbi:MAG: RnfABCDGE type electron transport complex subunit B [Bacteriovoracaceae bacterium]|nr:RnfABCDGE type electron transport complex subunit B [Bacteriovoracaceae bacterium]